MSSSTSNVYRALDDSDSKSKSQLKREKEKKKKKDGLLGAEAGAGGASSSSTSESSVVHAAVEGGTQIASLIKEVRDLLLVGSAANDNAAITSAIDAMWNRGNEDYTDPEKIVAFLKGESVRARERARQRGESEGGGYKTHHTTTHTHTRARTHTRAHCA